jgi:hypothetical protein
MFNLTHFTSSTLNVSNAVKISLVAATLTLSSLSAQAIELDPSELAVSVEQNISAASEGMLARAKQELILSIKEQISQQVFDSAEQTEIVKLDAKTPVLVTQQSVAK